MSNINKQELRNLAVAAKLAPSWYAVGEFGDVVDPAKPEWKPVHEFCKTFTAERVLALLDELEAKDKQIAELERNEIREEGNQFLVVRHPGKLPVVKHCAGELEGFLRQLLEHDPMATIDIVTHRYYGVGGQWVQDADEYLQMMAAAAGKGE
ncbi:ead/Ea22-like family protein [Enterobacter hormaechei]|uniref:ead/Ea22-like family protein n=1 Tax=Enterobacter hormaechei TaxID=158836 RepID=UPI0039FD9EB3